MQITETTSFAQYVIVVKDGKPVSNVCSVDSETLEYTQRRRSPKGFYETDTRVGVADKLIIPDCAPKYLLEHAREAGIEAVSNAKLHEMRRIQHEGESAQPGWLP